MLRYAFAALLLLPGAAAAEFRAGAYAVDVTPEKFPVVANCMFNERVATAAQDRLHARCIVFDDGTERVAIVTVDSCMMPREFLDATKRQVREMTGIREDRQLISATHTHSAPAVMGCLGSDPDPVYPAFLQKQIVRGVAKAVERLKPARIGSVVVDASKFTFNRRWILRSDKVRSDPFGGLTVRANMHPGYQNADFVGLSGPIDPALTLLAVTTPEGAPVAAWCNFSMHYFGSEIVSSDYYGLFCQRLAAKLAPDDPAFMASMSQGTSGDLMWMDYAQSKPWTEMPAYAEGLAAVAHDAWKKVKFDDKPTLAMVEEKLTLERRVPDAKRLEWAKDVQAKQKTEKPQSQQEIYAREAMFLHAEPTRELKLQVLRVGSLGIAAIPNEVFAITGLKIKDLALFYPMCVVELANGAEGYIPPPEQHHLGGYTTWPARSAGLEVGAEPKIVERITAMSRKLVGRDIGVDYRVGDYVAAVLADQPQAYWWMDEFGGAKLRPYQGKGPGAELEPGFALALPGPSGVGGPDRCVQFVGGRMKADFPGAGDAYSVEFWLWNGFPTDVRDVTGYAFGRGSDDLAITRKGTLRFGPLEGKAVLEPRKWYHVVVTRDGDQCKVYLDGSSELDGKVPAAEAKTFYFGDRGENKFGLEGRLDEVAVYAHPLTAERVKKHFDAARP